MASSGSLLLTTLVFVLIVSFNAVFAISCWQCSSDAPNGAFCDDPFMDNAVAQSQAHSALVHCSIPFAEQNTSNKFAYCRKIKKRIHGRTVISRSCFWEDIDAPQYECHGEQTLSYFKTESCFTCANNACNGVAQYGPIGVLVAFSAALVQFIF